jgi:hypothetical protein
MSRSSCGLRRESESQTSEVRVMSPRLLTAILEIVLANAILFQRALGREKDEPPPPPYNPYPPGILPSNSPSEITRVQGEIRGIFDEAQTEWLTLPPLILTGNPPTIQGLHQGLEVFSQLPIAHSAQPKPGRDDFPSAPARSEA